MTIFWVLLAAWLLLSPLLALGCAALMRAGKGPQPMPTYGAPAEAAATVSSRPDDVRRPAAA